MHFADFADFAADDANECAKLFVSAVAAKRCDIIVWQSRNEL